MKRIIILLVMLMATSIYAKDKLTLGDIYQLGMGECMNAYYTGFMAGVMWANDKFNDNGEFYAWIRTQINNGDKYDVDGLNAYMRKQADLMLSGKGLNNKASNKNLITLFKW